jgi:hypothetical protein
MKRQPPQLSDFARVDRTLLSAAFDLALAVGFDGVERTLLSAATVEERRFSAA